MKQSRKGLTTLDSLGVLGIAVILELLVLYKAGKEILHEVGISGSGIDPLTKSFAYLNRAKPATKLVFMEDLVATSGGLLAMIAIIISHYSGLGQVEGLASIIIGLMMFYVVGRVFLENARGALGETDDIMRGNIAEIVLADSSIKDIQRLDVTKEGEHLHVEVEIEVDPTLTIAEVDDIKDRLERLIYAQKGVTSVVIEFDEDDQIREWT